MTPGPTQTQWFTAPLPWPDASTPVRPEHAGIGPGGSPQWAAEATTAPAAADESSPQAVRGVRDTVRTPAPALPQRRPATPRHALPRPGGDLRLTPLYAALLHEWRERGAAVPGAVDPEWHRLVSWQAMEADVRRTLRSLRLQRSLPE
ncbi:hypothetical protein AQJ66_04835 [Streptomyces bungoensis]|uniref:Uncharacterized protein n=1 Tax=Streptomyces bungoensis TaxID=285568 RepID=A0A117RGI4_9ACTN|nr:hypothetical protein AQJ66_04835 [Streptomyces bungoensis]